MISKRASKQKMAVGRGKGGCEKPRKADAQRHVLEKPRRASADVSVEDLAGLISSPSSKVRTTKWNFPEGHLPDDYTQGTGSEEDEAKYNYEWAVSYTRGAYDAPTGPDDNLDVIFHKTVTQRLREVCDTRGVSVTAVAADPLEYFVVEDWVIEWPW